jgi:hypothetical protein
VVVPRADKEEAVVALEEVVQEEVVQEVEKAARAKTMMNERKARGVLHPLCGYRYEEVQRAIILLCVTSDRSTTLASMGRSDFLVSVSDPCMLGSNFNARQRMGCLVFQLAGSENMCSLSSSV